MSTITKCKSGFTLSSFLLAVLIVCLMVPMSVMCLKVIQPMIVFDEFVQDEIAISQLRRIGMLGYDFEVRNDEVTFLLKGQESRLRFLNKRIILQPGTQIFVSEIDGVRFYEENDVVYMEYYRKDEVRQTPLFHK